MNSNCLSGRTASILKASPRRISASVEKPQCSRFHLMVSIGARFKSLKRTKDRATAQGFDAHCSRPGEQIPPGGVHHIPGQDVEQRFLHPVGDRAGGVAGHGLQLASARRAGDDSKAHLESTLFLAAMIFPCDAMMGTTQPVDRIRRWPLVCAMASRASLRTSACSR